MFRKTLLLIAALALLCLNPLLADGANVGFLLSGLTQLGGGVVTSGWVYAYAAGTTNLKTLYSDAALTTALANPVQLDTAGRLIAYGSGQYKFVVKDQYLNTLFTVDNVEVESLASLLTDTSDPFGASLSQTNMAITNAIIASATITDLAVLNAITLSNLSVNNTKIAAVATATLTTEAVNLGQMQALIASYVPTGLMEVDGSNAASSVAFPGSFTVNGSELMEVDGSNAASSVAFPGSFTVNGSELMEVDGSNAGTSVAFPGSFTVNGSELMEVDGSNAAIGQDISMANHKLTNVATGTSAQDAVNKGQMDAAIQITPPAAYVQNVTYPDLTQDLNLGLREDLARTWEVASDTAGETLLCLEYLGDGVCLAGGRSGVGVRGTVYRSADYGKTWTQTSLNTNYAISAMVNMGNGKVLAGQNYSGEHMYFSEDYGVTWAVRGNVLPSVNALSYVGNGVCFAGTDGYKPLYRSTDYGETWVVQENHMQDYISEIYCLEYMGNGRSIAGAGNDGKMLITDSLEWFPYGVGLPQGNYGMVYCLANLGNGRIIGGTEKTNQIIGSINNGNTWATIATLTLSLGAVKSVENVGYGVCLAGNYPDGDIYKSKDYGYTWTRVLDSADEGINDIKYLGDGIVLAVSSPEGKIYRSTLYKDQPGQESDVTLTNLITTGTLAPRGGTIEPYAKYHRVATMTLALANTWTDVEWDYYPLSESSFGFTLLSSSTIEVASAALVQISGCVRPRWTGAAATVATVASRVVYSTDAGVTWNEARCLQAVEGKENGENEVGTMGYHGSIKATAGTRIKLQARVSSVSMLLAGWPIFDHPVAATISLFTTGN